MIALKSDCISAVKHMHRVLTQVLLTVLVPLWSASSDAAYNLEPLYLESVGHYAPLDYYPVDVAVDRDYVYSLDLFKEEIQKLDSEGRIIEKFGVIDKWTRDIAVDAAGNTYTVDPSVGKIRKYSPDGTVLLEIGGIGTQPGQFARLLSIVLDEDGNIYVADQATELSAFDSKGELLWNNMASVVADGDLVRPQGIARDSTGNLYVADSARNQIVIFDANGSYLRALGPAGDGWAMQSPVGVSIGADGEIYVLLRLQQEAQIGRDQVLKFSNDGNLLASWGAKGRAPGELWEAQGITLGPDGDVWVAGYMGHNITRFKQDGSLISEWNGHDIKPYEFAQVRGAEVGNNGLLYVTDFWNQSVQVFDRFGQFQFMFGERGQGNSTYFNFPRFTAANAAGELYISDDNEVRRLAADGTFLDKSDTIVRYAGGIEIDNRGDVWVTSSEHDYIRRYTPDLKLLQEFDGTGIPKGLKNPFGLAQGPSGKIYVADTLNHRIIRLSEDGAYELEWGSRGSAAGEFSAPVGLTTDSEGNVYVSETWNKRIQVFSPDGDYLAGWRVPGQPDKDVGRVYELSMDGDYILYAPDHTEGQAEVHKYALAPDLDLSGKPVYSVGQDLGYFLWSDDGSNWHLRWSSDGVQHDFSGIVISTSAFGSSTPFDMESGSGDKLQSVSASRIEFNATEAVGEDGIDFSVNETGVITIYLSIDGVERAELVTVGAGEFSPNTLPVPLKTQYVEVQSIDTVGQPAYVPGQDAGYFLWQGDNGEWNLRWSGDSVTTFNYQGTIKSNSPLTNVREYSFESDDNLVIVSSYELAFNAYAGAGEDGLQFYTSGGAEVTFDLLVNNDLNVTNVYVGSSGESPSTMPFTLLAANPGPPNTDTEAPTVSITEPADGATVAGTVQVLAQAFDNTGIEKVTFGIDGAWAGRDFTPPYTFTWDSSTHPNGVAKLQAVAFDLAGNTTKSVIYVTVDNQFTDTEAPTVSITEPADGATVAGTVQVLAQAFDNTGIEKVTFGIDGAWAGRDFTPPYTFTWDSSTHPNGVAKLQAVAFDLAGNTTKSVIYVTVDNQFTDTEAPTVSITEPADGATVAGTVQVLAQAFDNTGIEKVTFGIDGAWAGRDFTPPYTFTWDSSTHPNGVAKLQAVAFDLAGNKTKAVINVTVGN